MIVRDIGCVSSFSIIILQGLAPVRMCCGYWGYLLMKLLFEILTDIKFLLLLLSKSSWSHSEVLFRFASSLIATHARPDSLHRVLGPCVRFQKLFFFSAWPRWGGRSDLWRCAWLPCGHWSTQLATLALKSRAWASGLFLVGGTS